MFLRHVFKKISNAQYAIAPKALAAVSVDPYTVYLAALLSLSLVGTPLGRLWSDRVYVCTQGAVLSLGYPK